jgi:hypothetical protein
VVLPQPVVNRRWDASPVYAAYYLRAVSIAQMPKAKKHQKIRH